MTRLRADNYDGTEKEWSAFLQHVFVYTQDSGLAEDQAKILEADCSVSGRGSKAVLSITLRSRIEDITHRLGTVDLAYTENTDEVDLFGWACQLAKQRNAFRDQLAVQKKDTARSEETVKTLQRQLIELVEAKKDHEDQLLSKFELLLNAKKLNIRNQQRILQTAKLDRKALDQLQLTIDGSQTDGGSGRRKRPGDTGQALRNQSDNDSEGFEPMDVDDKSDEDERAGEPGTPDRSETETASEDEAALHTRTSTKPTAPSLEQDVNPQPAPKPSMPRKESKVTETRKPEPMSVDSDEETATEDDEL